MTDPQQPSGWSDPTYQPPAADQQWSASAPPSYPPADAPVSQPTVEGYAYQSPPLQDPYGYQAQPQYAVQGYAQPAYGQPMYAPAYAVARPTNGLAIASLVCSLVGLATFILFPVGAIMGHIARRQIQQTGEQGDGMALAGIIIGWIGTGLLVVCCGGYALLVAGIIGSSAATGAGSGF